MPPPLQLVRARRQHPTWLARLRVGPTDVWVAPWARYPVLRTSIQLALIGLVILALGVAAVLVGHRGPPPPFGPAANGILVFDVGGRIFARDADSAGVRPLTADGTVAFGPTWSLDGQRLAYWARAKGAGFALVIDRRNGSPAIEIPVEPAVVADVGVPLEWAPNGEWIAFVASDHGISRVFIARTDGSGTIAPVTPPSLWAVNPSWSPDGRRLAVTATTARNPSGRGDAAYYVLDPLVASDPVRLPTSPLMPAGIATPPTLSSLHARWLPDPNRSVLLYWVWGARKGDIAVFDLATRTETAISREATDDGFPTWSPDGKRIAWHRFTATNQEMLVMPLDAADHGESPSVVLSVSESATYGGPNCADDPVVFDQIFCTGATWSPDGHWLYGYDGREASVMIVSAERPAPVERLKPIAGTGTA